MQSIFNKTAIAITCLMANFLLSGFFTSIQAKRRESEIHENIRIIEKFYKEYIQNECHALRDMLIRFYPRRDSILRNHLHNGFREKLIRMELETSFDMILHSPKVTKDMLSSIQAEHLQGDWYRIRFQGNKNGLALKAKRKNRKLLINYISPQGVYDYGTDIPPAYGDHLYYEHPPRIPIDHSTAHSFLKSFYEAYTAGLSSIMENRQAYLFELKWKHLTENAIADLKQIVAFSVKNMKAADLPPYFDLMIYGYDFDRSWQRDLKFIQIDKNTYRLPCVHSPLIRYQDGKPQSIPNVILTVIKENQEYKIDRIDIKYLEICPPIVLTTLQHP